MALSQTGPTSALQDGKYDLSPLNVSLVVVGSYLFVYRLFMTKRCRGCARTLTSVAAGASLVFFAPGATWFPEEYRVFAMLALGSLFGTCFSISSVIAADITLSAYIGSLIWQLGLCTSTSDLGVANLHFMVMTLFIVVFTLIFCATPLGPVLYERMILPMLAAALVTSGLAGIGLPGFAALSAPALLADECAVSHGDADGLLNVESFAVLSLCGAVLQGVLLYWRQKQVEQARRDKNELAKSLLPEAAPDKNEGGLTEWHVEDESEATNHFQTLIRAIYAPEGSNMDHLNDHDKKLVQVCREDEFERDRVTWGGGLI